MFTQIDLLSKNLLLSTLVAVTGVAFPIGISLLLFPLGFNYSLLDGFAAGSALAATSLGTTFALLSAANNKSKEDASQNLPDLRVTRIGSVLLSAALIDDIIGLVLVSVIPSVRTAGGQGLVEHILRPVGVSVAFFLLVIVSPIQRSFAYSIAKVHHSLPPIARERGALLIIVASLSGLASGAYYTGASPLLGAWVAGALIGNADRSTMIPAHTPQPFTRSFERYVLQLQTYLLAPLFFASIGTAIPFLDLWTGRIIWQGVTYAILMTVSKMVVGVWILGWGTLDPTSSAKTSLFPASLLSTAMVARGEVALIIAQLGGLGEDAYKVVMWAILVCTVLGPTMTGLLLRWKRLECSAGIWG